MDHAAIQRIINANRRRDGAPYTCRRCSTVFATYGSMWCRDCRDSGHCLHQQRILGHIIRTDGSRQGWWWCISCGKILAAKKADGLGHYLLHDLRNEQDTPPCERCASAAGTQIHHWAPRAIFGDREADRWPIAHLCQPCHALWHRLMRESGGVRLPPERRIDEYVNTPISHTHTKDAA